MAETGKAALEDAVLRQFTHPDHSTLSNLLALWHYRGDLTQRTDDLMRVALGKPAHDHYHWDTAATNGRVLIVLPRYRHPEGIEPPPGFGFPAEWFWCFSQVELAQDIELASAGLVGAVPTDVRESLAIIPGLEWIKVRRVHFVEHGRGRPKAKHRPAPEGVLFFQFPGGLGLAVARKEAGDGR